jgi:hypothetical protein
MLRRTITDYGLPREIYAGKAEVFLVHTKKQVNWTAEKLSSGHPLAKARFDAIVGKLGIGLVSAHAPRAKGCIERLRPSRPAARLARP